MQQPEPRLEGPEEYITLRRAGEISGITPNTLRIQAIAGKLSTVKLGRDHVTTRRLLHAYLMAADSARGGRRLPLPDGYIAPE